MDFWDLNGRIELGSTKSYCSVSIEWGNDGYHLLTAVLFERVRVDNELKVFIPNGKQLIHEKYHVKGQELNEVYWQPMKAGSFVKPDLTKLLGIKEEKKEVKPKKMLYRPPGGGNSAFSQIMREEMSGAGEKEGK